MPHENFIKVCFLGEETTGKDELREKNWLGLQPKWANQMGSDFTLKEATIQGRAGTYPMTIQLWDVASHERFAAVRDIYYHGGNAAIIIFDVTEPKTFLKSADWIKEFWTHNGKGMRPVVLVGNRVQLRKKMEKLTDDIKIKFTAEKFETQHKDKETNQQIEYYVPSWNKEPDYIPASWASDYAEKLASASGFETPYVEIDTTGENLSHVDELLYILGSLCLPFVIPEEREAIGIPGAKGDHFSKSRVHKLLLNAGAIRVSKGAIAAMNLVLEKKGLTLAGKAIGLARAAKRKTVTGEDIYKAKSL